MYSEKQVNAALSLYDQLGAITAVIRSLGYPSRTMLYNWLKTRKTSYRSPKTDDLSTQQTVFCTHQMKHLSVRHASLEQKLDIIRRCFEKCFYGRNFASYTTVMCISYIDTYIKWCNNKPIKKSLGYHSPVDYRR